MATIIDRRLWLDAKGNLVEDGDPRARFLWAHGAGAEKPNEEAKAKGYRPSGKARSPSEDKEVKGPSENKDGYQALTVDSLREIAAERNVPVPAGPKAVIIQLLEEADARDIETAEAAGVGAPAAANEGGGT